MSTSPPTDLHELQMYSKSMADINNFGFPLGYFIVKNIATGRLLDVKQDSVKDGAEVILWPEKEVSLVEGLRDIRADNQVFYIDTTGALCSRQSGHAIDVQDGRLVLRHRRPMSYPYPNAFSHPLPHFVYSSATREIYVHFQGDPSYSMSNSEIPRSHAWTQQSYVLSSVPVRKPRTILDDASEMIANVIENPLSPFTSFFNTEAKSSAQEVRDNDIDLCEEELLEEDRAEGEDDDDSPEKLRHVRVVKVDETDNDRLSDAAKRRRAWEVLPLRRTRATYSHTQ